MGKDQTDHHNDGQTDRAEGNGYNAPHSTAEEIFSWPGSSSDKDRIADNEAYGKGYKNADKQD